MNRYRLSRGRRVVDVAADTPAEAVARAAHARVRLGRPWPVGELVGVGLIPPGRLHPETYALLPVPPRLTPAGR